MIKNDILSLRAIDFARRVEKFGVPHKPKAPIIDSEQFASRYN